MHFTALALVHIGRIWHAIWHVKLHVKSAAIAGNGTVLMQKERRTDFKK